jgi:hypothetical protein
VLIPDGRRADISGMILTGFSFDGPTGVQPIPRKSGAQRQRDYRQRHPDRVRAYNGHRRAQRRRGNEHAVKVIMELKQRIASEMAAAAPAPRQPLLLPAPPVRLCLPAPSEEPMFILPDRTPERVLAEAARREDVQQRRAA